MADAIKKILSYKKTAWEYEDEHRFLGDKDCDIIKMDIYYFAKIEKITAIYFGDSCGNIANKNKICKENTLTKTEKFS